jgi:hypothetical protein
MDCLDFSKGALRRKSRRRDVCKNDDKLFGARLHEGWKVSMRCWVYRAAFWRCASAIPLRSLSGAVQRQGMNIDYIVIVFTNEDILIVILIRLRERLTNLLIEHSVAFRLSTVTLFFLAFSLCSPPNTQILADEIGSTFRDGVHRCYYVASWYDGHDTRINNPEVANTFHTEATVHHSA